MFGDRGGVWVTGCVDGVFARCEPGSVDIFTKSDAPGFETKSAAGVRGDGSLRTGVGAGSSDVESVVDLTMGNGRVSSRNLRPLN